MSRTQRTRILTVTCFPRVSGDEPLTGLYEDGDVQFSPRERG